MPRFAPSDFLIEFRAMTARGEPIVGGGACPAERALTEQTRKFKAIRAG